jgi:S-adenosyl methyltransferase
VTDELPITHSTSEVSGERVIEAVRQWNAVAPVPYTLRSPAQIAAFFTGLDLIEPGIVSCPEWRPGPGRPAACGRWTSSAPSAASEPPGPLVAACGRRRRG